VRSFSAIVRLGPDTPVVAARTKQNGPAARLAELAQCLHLATTTIKIMSLSCHWSSPGIADHAATEVGTNPNEPRDVMTSGDTSDHEI
jgi:hypothetical protein